MSKIVGQFFDFDIKVNHDTFVIGPYEYKISELDEVAKNIGLSNNQRNDIFTAHKELLMKVSGEPEYFDESRVAIPKATTIIEYIIPLLAKSRWIRHHFFYGHEGLSVRVTAYLAKNTDAPGQFVDHPSPVVRYQLVNTLSAHTTYRKIQSQ